MAASDHLPLVPRDSAEALIDLRVRYSRATRMVWTLIGIVLTLALTLGLVARSISDLSKDLAVQRRVAEQQEDRRRIDRAEQRYSLCQRNPPPAAPLCDGYETLEAAYRTEKVDDPPNS
jgi:hypothetical protein